MTTHERDDPQRTEDSPTESQERYQELVNSLEQRVVERTRELETLLDISRTISSTLDLQTLLGSVLEQLKAIVDYTGATVFTIDDGDLVLQATRGPFAEDPSPQTWFPAGNQIDAMILQEMQSVVIGDVFSEEPSAQLFRKAIGDHINEIHGHIRSWMGIPLTYKGKAIGSIALDHVEPNRYTHHHAKLVMTFANHVAIAIENARLYQQAQELAAIQERQKLARELHDSVSQALYGIGLGARTARKMLDIDATSKQELIQPLDYVLTLAEVGLSEMRALIFELHPDSLAEEGLVAVLEKQAIALEDRYKLSVELSLCEEPDLSIDEKEAIYRVALEAMQNSVKHAHASRIVLQLRQTSSGIMLEAQDNGIGFNPEGPFPGHLGLESMQERAEKLGGQLVIDSTTGKGTKVSLHLPVRP